MAFTANKYTRIALQAVIDRAAVAVDVITDKITRHDGSLAEFLEQISPEPGALAVKVGLVSDTPSSRTGAQAVLKASVDVEVMLVIATGSASERITHYQRLDDAYDEISQLFDVNRSEWSLKDVPISGVSRGLAAPTDDKDYIARSIPLNLQIVVNNGS